MTRVECWPAKILQTFTIVDRTTKDPPGGIPLHSFKLMVFERLARFKVTFTTLSMDVLATEKCFAEVAT